MRPVSLVVRSALFAIVPVRALTADPAAPRQVQIVVQHVTVIDVTSGSLQPDQSIVIAGGRISALGPTDRVVVPSGAKVIDATGKFAIPGLADMHQHLGDGTESKQDLKKNLGLLLAAGITLMFDPAGLDPTEFAELKNITRRDDAPYPRYYSAGKIFGAKGGWGGDLIGGLSPATADEARAAVRKQKAAAVDAVKLVYDDMSGLRTQPWPILKPDVMAALIDEAHRQGLKAHVHVPILKFAKEALRAGADGLVHGIISDPVDDEFLALMKENHAIYIGTHVLFEDCADRKAWVKREAEFDKHEFFSRSTYDGLTARAVLASWEKSWHNTRYTKQRMPVLYANLLRVYKSGVLVISGADSGVPV
jgi:imidazolonepropionase-like amidohydrolase